MAEDRLGDARETLIKARYYFGRGEFQTAARYCRQALAGDHGNIEAMLVLGAVAEKTGASAAAASVFSRVLSIKPANLTAQLGLGSALVAAGKWAEAAAVYERAIEINATAVDALNGLAPCRSRSETARPRC